MKLSTKLMTYNFFVRAFISWVIQPSNIIRYGLTPDEVRLLTDFISDWIEKFDKYCDPLTHGTDTTFDVNEAYLVGYPLTEGIRMSIKSKTTIVLSGKERLVLNIKKPSKRKSHVKPQKEGPGFVCIERNDGSLTMIAVDPKNSREFGKPENCDIGLMIAFTTIGGPLPGPGDFSRLPDETSAEFELIVSIANKDKLMSLKGTYINARGEQGDEGVVFMMVI